MTRRQPGARARRARPSGTRRTGRRSPRWSKGAAAIRDSHDARSSEQGRRYAIVDAVTDAHLHAIGDGRRRSIALLTGGSGVAVGLPENFRNATAGWPARDAASPARGRRPCRRRWLARARALPCCRSAPGAGAHADVLELDPLGDSQTRRRSTDAGGGVGCTAGCPSAPVLVAASAAAGQGRGAAGKDLAARQAGALVEAGAVRHRGAGPGGAEACAGWWWREARPPARW